MRAQLDGQRFGEADHRPFRRRIDRTAGEAQVAGGRGQVDHHAGLGRLEQRNGLARAQELAGDVDGQRAVPVGLGQGLDKTGGPRHAGVVHQHIQPAQLARHGLEQRRHAVSSDTSARSACTPGSSAGSAASRDSFTSQTNTRSAGAMEHAGHLQAQPVGARGDQDLLSSEIDFFEHASCLLVLTWPTPLGDIRYIFHYAKRIPKSNGDGLILRLKQPQSCASLRQNRPQRLYSCGLREIPDSSSWHRH